MQILDKDIIKKDIEKYLSIGKRRFNITFPVY